MGLFRCVLSVLCWKTNTGQRDQSRVWVGEGSGVSPGSLLTGLTFIERINWLHSLQDKDTHVIAVAVSRADHQCSQQSPANRHFITD